MEFRGQEPRFTFGTVHGPGYSGGQSIGMRYQIPASTTALDQDFHVYAVEWNPGLIVFSLDGYEFFSVRPSDLPGGADWVFDKPFFILLNVAVGGNFVGPVGAGVSFPQTMLVDWVKVWEAAP
ncbi:MAG: glycoside hydrolase family 16 protein [Anaeromyxobacteraceae bacterium]